MADPSDGPRILSRSDHPISRKNIDVNAIKVLYRLHHAGFESFLVGGAVRDLMLGRQPKDFDVSTGARPQQVRRLFRNSRIIGRRFRLVHIYFREGIIEVSTFRRNPDPVDQAGGPDELLITDDNVFGTPAEDAYRRDFTVNALIYNIADFSVIDYVNGLEDLERGFIRTIGKPDVRFCEDPVRMLRACELAGRLGFTIDGESEQSIRHNRQEIAKASAARLTEEIGQILQSGSSESVMRLAMSVGLLEVFLPEAFTMLTSGEGESSQFQHIPSILDDLIGRGRALSAPALMGSLILPSILLRRRDIEALNQRPITRSALRRLSLESVDHFATRFNLARSKTERIQQAIWSFHRLGENWRSAAKRLQFASQPGFDEALDLLEIMVTATGEGAEQLELWQRIRARRPEPPSKGRAHGRRRRGRRRRRQ